MNTVDKAGPWLPGHFCTPNMAIPLEVLEEEVLAIAKAGSENPLANDEVVTLNDLLAYIKVVHITDEAISKMIKG